jgi:hypothetical protein
LGLLAAALVLLPSAAFVVTDHAVYHFERDNAFCVSCHLHEKLLATFEAGATQATDLSAVHFSALDEPRCIACHKGEGTIERAKVLAVAGWDAVEYVAGDRNEPDHSHVPIADVGCTHCHDQLGARPDGPDFHQRAEHRNLPITCVSCHQAHRTGDPKQSFLAEDHVVPECRTCHPDLAASN